MEGTMEEWAVGKGRSGHARTWSWNNLVNRYLRSSRRDFSWTSRPASTFSGVGSVDAGTSRWRGGAVSAVPAPRMTITRPFGHRRLKKFN
jgi:hypothetical protein